MTDKITLANVSNPQNLTSLQATINANNATIVTAFDNTLSRDGTAPNQMGATLDMNSNQIINLPAPGTVNSPARLIDVTSNPTIVVPPTGTSGATVPLLNGNNTFSGNNIHSGTETFNAAAIFNSSATFNSTVTVPNNTISNIELTTMPANTIKGNNTNSNGNVLDLTVSQVAALIGGWNNVQITYTANHTLSNTDNGATLVLGGGAFYTISSNSAGSYSSPQFIVRLLNADSRGKTIALNGISSFILYPGQSCFAWTANGTWITEVPQRWRKTGATFFVDAVNGNNANDGLASGSGALQTITAAYNALIDNVDCQNALPTISIASGTYTESLGLFGQLTGTNAVLFQGAGSTVVTWKPSSNYCLLIGDNAECQVSGIKFDNSGGAANATAISMHQYSVIDVLTDINFGSFPGASSTHINNDKGGYVNLPSSYTISGSAGVHVQMSSGGIVTQGGGGTVSFTGTPTFTTIYFLVYGAMMLMNSAVTFSGAITAGAQKYSIDFLSVFQSSGSTLPGSVAGVAAHGSQFN